MECAQRVLRLSERTKAGARVLERWVICRRSLPEARIRLLCFPYAGGGASIYGAWSQALPDWIEVSGIQLPGRENRLSERPYNSLNALVESVVEVLSPYFDRPFAFFGHSLGALIAFEVTRHLQRLGRGAPVCLIASGRESPQIYESDPPMHALPEDEFIREINRRYNGIPQTILEEPELLCLLIPALRADLKLTEVYTYAPSDLLTCPISVMGGEQDRRVSRADLEAWKKETRSSFSMRMFPGDHFFLHSSRNRVLKVLSEDLLRYLESEKTPRSPLGLPAGTL